MSDVNVLLCAVDSAMNTLAAFDRDRADVTARVSFALSSVLARVALETERCRRALADAEAASYTDEETGNTAENPEAARLRAKLDALEALNERCILAGGALSAAWAQESRQSETHVSDALHRCGVYLKKLNRIALSPDPGSITGSNHSDAPVFVCIVDSALYPEIAEHIRVAQDIGFPDILTLDRGGAAERRKASLAPIKASRIWDRDEYPCACFKEGGAGAHVMYVAGTDNRGAGSYMGWQMRSLPDGAKVRVRVI